MTTRRTPEYSARPARPVGRTALAGLALAAVAGLAWVGGMIYTIAGWTG
ncbi:morphogenic membrane protein MmpA [Streptomyces sp. NPDC055794]